MRRVLKKKSNFLLSREAKTAQQQEKSDCLGNGLDILQFSTLRLGNFYPLYKHFSSISYLDSCDYATNTCATKHGRPYLFNQAPPASPSPFPSPLLLAQIIPPLFNPDTVINTLRFDL